MVAIDSDFPILLGQELYRPDSKFILKYVLRPRVKHEFFKGPGDTIQLDRYKFWSGNDGLTKESRERSDTQTIGISQSKSLEKDKVIMTIREYTGPASDTNPNQPSTFQIPIKTILTAQRALWQYGQRAFHDSIGSMNLLQDFRRWEDRLYCNEMLKSTFTYNPGGFADGDTVDLAGLDPVGLPPRFTVADIDQIVADMTNRNAPTFEDGNYCAVVSPYFLRDLRRDKEFLEISRYPGQVPVEAMTPGSTGMAPPQVPMVAGPWVAGLMGAQARDVNLQQTMPKNEIVSFHRNVVAK